MKTYEPDNSIKKGYLSVFSEILNDLWSNRWLTSQLFKRSFLAAYKQSFLGIFWAVLVPVISVGTFILLKSAGIFISSGINVPYPIYAVLGLAIWQIFSIGIIASSNSLIFAGNMVTKINFSKKSLVLASAAQSLIPFIVQFVLVLGLSWYYGFKPSAMTFFYPLLILPIMFLTFGLGLILSLLNGIFRDIGNAVSMGITFLLFLTPVFYPAAQHGLLSKVTAYNPLYFLIAVPRDMFLYGESASFNGYVLASIFSVFVFVFCLVAFHLTETRVTERI